MVGSLIGPAIGLGSSLFGASRADKSADQAAAAAQYAAYQQQQGIKKGIKQSEPYYQAGQNYLSPYVTAGTEDTELLKDIQGLNGPEAQQRALAMYRSSPSSNILQDVLGETARRTAGEFSAGGLYRSGAMGTELGRRLSDLNLGNYGNWQNLAVQGAQTGASAGSVAGQLAHLRGKDILAARTGMGTAGASGTIGAANAQMAGTLAGNNYLMNAAGRVAGTDFSKFRFPSFGTDWAGGSGGAAP